MTTYPNAIPTTLSEPEGVVGWVVTIETNYCGPVIVGSFDTLADAITYGKYRLQHDEWDVAPIASPDMHAEVDL